MLSRKLISFIVLLTVLVNSLPMGYAQSLLLEAGGMSVSSLSSSFPVLKGLKVYPGEPLHLDFIFDPGDLSTRDDSQRLIKYFLAALTIPEEDLWVNLSPYEKDRIIPEAFGRTGMGRDLLEQDYILKQVSAALLYPDQETGRKFWKEVYALTQEKYGTTDIPFDIFNKVWIVPDKAEVYENVRSGVVCITASRLKVMLEQDYQAEEYARGSRERVPEASASSSGVLREVIVPVIEKAVNEGKDFVLLRQIYQSLILAAWYKSKIRDSLLAHMYVDRRKTAGIETKDPKEARKIWGRYVEAFRKGAYNLVKDEKDMYSGEVVARKYFSGGVSAFGISSRLSASSGLPEQESFDKSQIIKVKLTEVERDFAEGSHAVADDLTAMIMDLKREGVAVFTPQQARQLLRMKSARERFLLLENILYLMQEDKYLFNSSQLMKVVLQYKLGNESVLFDEINWLKDQRNSRGKFLFSGSGVWLIALHSSDSQKKKDQVRYLSGLKDKGQRELFSGTDISRIISSGTNRDDIEMWVGLLSGFLRMQEPLFSGANMTDIICKRGSEESKKEFVEYLAGQKDALDKQFLFSGSAIGRIIKSQRSIKEKKRLIAFLRAFPGRQSAQAFFAGADIADIVTTGQSESAVVEFVGQLMAPDMGDLFDATAVARIVKSKRTPEEKIKWIKTLSAMRYGATEQALFNGANISQIILSAGDMEEISGFIGELSHLKREGTDDFLFSGFMIAEIIRAGGALSEKMDLIRHLMGYKDKSSRVGFFDGVTIYKFFLTGDSIQDKKALLDFLSGLRQENADAPFFTSSSVGSIMMTYLDVKAKTEMIAYLLECRSSDGDRLFTGRHIAFVVRNHKIFDKEKFDKVYRLLKDLGVPVFTLLFFCLFTDRSRDILRNLLNEGSSVLSYEDRRKVYFLLANTGFDVEHWHSLAAVLFGAQQDDILRIATERENRLAALADRITAGNLSDSDSKQIKEGLLGFSHGTRNRILMQVYLEMFQVFKARFIRFPERKEAFEFYFSSYDWSRKGAGIANLTMNLGLILQHYQSYLYWKSVPQPLKGILFRVNLLKRKGKQEVEIKDTLLKAGFSDFEISQALSYKSVSLDAPLKEDGEGTLLDLIAGSPGEEFFEDVDEEMSFVDITIMGVSRRVWAADLGGALQEYWRLDADSEMSLRIRALVLAGTAVNVFVDGQPVKLIDVLQHPLQKVRDVLIEFENDQDDAQTDTDSPEGEVKGGIDFDFVPLNRWSQAEGQIVFTNTDPDLLSRPENLSGLEPVILSICPLGSFRGFLEAGNVSVE